METSDDLGLFACGIAVALLCAVPFVLPAALLYLLAAAIGGASAIWLVVRRLNRRATMHHEKPPSDRA